MHLPLVVAERHGRRAAEVAVERPAVETVPGQQELEHRHVEAEVPGPHDPVAEERAPERAERGPRAVVEDSGDRQMRAALRLTHRCEGLRADQTVDRAAVQAERPQSDLHAGMLRVDVRARGRSEPTCDDEGREEKTSTHGRS